MKKILLSLMIMVAFLQPVKKAEAGAILVGTALATGGVTGAGLLFLGGTFGGIGAPVSALAGILTKDYSVLWFSLGLLVLDDNSYRVQEFKTIPPYMIDEIRYQVEAKANFVEEQNGIKQVVFSHAEVDELFRLADESVSAEELESLREAMTTKF